MQKNIHPSYCSVRLQGRWRGAEREDLAVLSDGAALPSGKSKTKVVTVAQL